MKKTINIHPFLKVFSYNGIVVFGKLISSFLVSKICAIYLGPSGYAILGNFKNILQGILGITASGFESGVVKHVAENKSSKDQIRLVISSAVTLSIVFSIIIGMCFFIFSKYISTYFLNDSSLSFVFEYMGIVLPLISLNFLIIYILNGLQKFKLYTILITISNILNALLTLLFVYCLNLKGALIAGFVVPSLSFISSLFFKDIRGFLGHMLKNLKYFSSDFFKPILTYVGMATYSSILLSLSYLLIRNKIITNLDTNTAGLWEAMNKISSFYMVFFSSLFTLYLLPQLTINKTILGYYNIMFNYFKYLLPFVMILFLGLFFFRSFVIDLFLTNEFKVIKHFFYLQLIGDLFKIIAFSIAYQFHAKKMVKFYLLTDAILYISFYFLSLYLINVYELYGVFYSYISSTVLYLVAVVISVYYCNFNYLKAKN